MVPPAQMLVADGLIPALGLALTETLVVAVAVQPVVDDTLTLYVPLKLVDVAVKLVGF